MSRRSSKQNAADGRRASLLRGTDAEEGAELSPRSRKSSLLENTFLENIFRRRSTISQTSNVSEELNSDNGNQYNRAYDISLLAGYLEEELSKIHSSHQAAVCHSNNFRHHLENSQKENTANSKFTIGAFYQFGYKDMPADHVEALRWYVRAAREGDIRAVNNIGVMLYHGGQFGPKDEVRGAQWLHVAAQTGDVHSKMNMSISKALSENPLCQNHEEAFALLKSLAETNPSKQILNNLACMYCKGLSVDNDYGKALHLFKKAAEMGSKVAEYNMGVMWLNGMGVKEDIKEANSWFKSSKSDPTHEDYVTIAGAQDATKLMFVATMTFYFV